MSAETKDVVDAIYRHQNPEDCAKAKYLIFPPCELYVYVRIVDAMC